VHKIITVREFARISIGEGKSTSLDEAHVTQLDFDWLCQLSASFRSTGAPLVQIDNRRWLRLDNYVGVLQTPSGTRIEILPKIESETSNVETTRALLVRMIQVAMDLPTRSVGATDLSLFDAPLTEWVIHQFLANLDHLVKRGIRFDYQQVEDELRYLRGQLYLPKQLRQPPGRGHYFQVRHDLFAADCPENRLLKAALIRAARHTQNSRNWRLSHELLSVMNEIPASQQIQADFRRWRQDRLMAHYEPIKPWCELILGEQMPLAVFGDWHGMSMLFPMEKLFEQYVEVYLRTHLYKGNRLTAPAASEYLCAHQGKRFFQLRPDFLISGSEQCWILDTKWKKLDSKDAKNHFGLSQSDFYQLFAYGHQYLQGVGDLALIYPMSPSFKQPMEPFAFSEKLRLWVLPFDLQANNLISPNDLPLPIKKIDIPGNDSNLLRQPVEYDFSRTGLFAETLRLNTE